MAGFEINTFVQALGDQCAAAPLAEKWVVAPSHRVGYQWLDQLARGGQPVLNARVKTMRSLAIDLAGPALASSGRSLVDRVEARGIMGRLLKELGAHERGYLCDLEPGGSLVDALVRVVGELRMAGVAPEVMVDERFEVADKGRQLRWLSDRFEASLDERQLADWPMVFEMAAARLAFDDEAIPKGTLLLFAQSDLAQLRGRERRLVDTIDSSLKQALPVDDPQQSPGWIASERASIFGAVGEVNEVREVMRRCARSGVPLDDIEIIVSDPVTYLPLLEEAATGSTDDAGVPISFADGVAIGASRPARALLGWLSWIRGGFVQSDLVRLIQEGLIDLHLPAELSVSATRAGAILREVPIGRGIGRYLPQIERQIRRRTEERQQAVEEDKPTWAARCETDIAVLEILRDRLPGLIPDGAEEDRISAASLLETASSLIARRCRVVSGLDHLARQVLGEEISSLAHSEDALEGQGVDMADQLADLTRATRVRREGPRPGAVYVSSLGSGGHSGRGHTFVVGLDDSRFPGAGLQDPLLLDEERRSLSAELATAAERLALKVDRFWHLVARLRGKVTLSFCSRSLSDDRQMFPAQPVMRLYQQLSGEDHADQERFFEWLGSPVSFAPVEAEQALDSSEWWIASMLADAPVKNPRTAVEAAFPNLARGRIAEEARQSERFTAYDGYVPEAGTDLNPYAEDARALSASRLEKLGACPRDYFFSHVLGIEPPEEYGHDPSVWLDPMTRGSVLHEVFRRFMVELRAKKRTPELDRDEPLIKEILDAELAAAAEEVPPPSDEVFRHERDEMRRIARVFVRAEQLHCEQWSPAYFEVAVGLPPEGDGSELDSEEPIGIPLAPGKQIRVRGRIDRIDAPAKGKKSGLALWDYKTGSAYKYKQSDPFKGGRVVQHVFYLEMLRAHLARLNDRRDPGSFGYFFPGLREYGRRMEWSARELEQGRSVIAVLCDLLASGSFPDTDDPDDLKYSDYGSLREDVREACRQSWQKLVNRQNTAITDFARLRSIIREGDDE